MGSNTSTLNLYKPDPLEFVDVVTALNNNMDLIDAFAAAGSTRIISVVDPAFFLTAYPLGPSIMPLAAADFTSFPAWAVESGANSASVLTIKASTGTGFQIWFRTSTTTDSMYARWIGSATKGNWFKCGGPDLLGYQATSNVNLTQGNWLKVATNTTLEARSGAAIVADSGGMKVSTTGLYYCEGMITVPTAAGGTDITFGFDVDGAGPGNFNRTNFRASGQTLVQTFSMTRPFNAGDTVYMWANQTSSPTNTQVATNRRMYMERKSVWNNV